MSSAYPHQHRAVTLTQTHWSAMMAHPATELAVDELTVEERLTLLGRLWDSLLDSGPPPVPAWHLDIIRQRIAAADANPGASIPLEELRAELQRRRA